MISEVLENFFNPNEVATPLIYLNESSKHKVSVIMAMLSDAKVILLDDPCIGLNKDEKYQILSLIKNLTNERFVIFST